MRVEAVVVNWNGGEALRHAVDSLRRQGQPPARIRIVDNGSTDDSLAAVESDPRVLVRRTGRNLGFARAANLGIADALAAGAEGILLFNNDAVADPGMLENLLAAATRRPETGLLAPRIYRDREADLLWCCGVDLGRGPNLGRLRGFGQKGRGRFESEEEVDSLTGCALLVRREVFERVGLLDEGYFVYGEDLEFCFRASRAGFRCGYVPSAVAEHAGGWSTGGGYAPARKYLSGYATGRFLREHGGPGLRLNALLYDLVLWPVAYLIALRRGEGRAARAKLAGIWAGWRRRPVGPSELEIWSRR
jgi:GT2 family glycosyltransferase